MSYGYPDGCTQADHDRAFGELGPSPEELAAEADADNDLARDDACWDNVREVELEELHDAPEMISKHDAAIITRVFMRIQEQIDKAEFSESLPICRILGQLQHRVFGCDWTPEL